MTEHIEHHRRSTDIEYRLGANSQAISLMLLSQSRMESDISIIKNTLAELKGERRVAVLAAGGLGSALMLMLSVVGRKLGIVN